MRLLIVSALILVAMLLQSCDPALGIDFINNTGSSVSIKVIQSGERRYFYTDSSLNGQKEFFYLDTINFSLAATPETKVSFFDGMGQWYDNELNALAHSVRYVEIRTPKETKFYTDSVQIRNFFSGHLKEHLFFNRIEVDIK